MDRRFGTAPSAAEIEAIARASLERLAEATEHHEELAALYEEQLPRLGPAGAAVALRLGELEEEKLAGDVYAVLAAQYGDSELSRIAASEDKHAASLRRLLTTYGIADPTVGYAAGDSFIGKVRRRIPSNAYNAPCTAPAVGTKPISPTPLAPNGPSGS